MREIAISDLEIISGGVNWDEVGTGLGAVGMAIAIVGGPVGVLGTAAAAGLSFLGGIAIGDGMVEGKAYSSADGDE